MLTNKKTVFWICDFYALTWQEEGTLNLDFFSSHWEDCWDTQKLIQRIPVVYFNKPNSRESIFGYLNDQDLLSDC